VTHTKKKIVIVKKIEIYLFRDQQNSLIKKLKHVTQVHDSIKLLKEHSIGTVNLFKMS